MHFIPLFGDLTLSHQGWVTAELLKFSSKDSYARKATI